jgi:hypothetical protein
VNGRRLKTERQEVSMNWAQFVTIWKQLQMALAGTAAAVALMAGSAVGRADPLEPSLIGAWAASAPDCVKLFVGQGGGLAYRQPVDKFALDQLPAAISFDQNAAERGDRL